MHPARAAFSYAAAVGFANRIAAYRAIGRNLLRVLA